jgi:hypothetical protein
MLQNRKLFWSYLKKKQLYAHSNSNQMHLPYNNFDDAQNLRENFTPLKNKIG